jgi:hypothetical protein
MKRLGEPKHMPGQGEANPPDSSAQWRYTIKKADGMNHSVGSGRPPLLLRLHMPGFFKTMAVIKSPCRKNSTGIMSAAFATLGIRPFKAPFSGIFSQLVVGDARFAFFAGAASLCFLVGHLCPSFLILTVQPDILSAFKCELCLYDLVFSALLSKNGGSKKQDMPLRGFCRRITVITGLSPSSEARLARRARIK